MSSGFADTKFFIEQRPGASPAIIDRATYTGRVFWVGASITGIRTAGDTAAYGKSPARPFATVAYAETQCLSQRGDTIHILENYTETLASGSGAVVLLLDVANLQIIGHGRSTRPVFLIDGHAANYINITGADTRFVNCAFKSGHANVAKGLSVAAPGVEFLGCHFLENTTNENFLFAIQATAAGDNLLIEDSTFISVNASADACIQLVGACNGVKILHNYMNAPCTTSLIEAITNPCLDLQINHNHLINIVEGNDLAGLVDLVASSTGSIHDNICYLADDTDILTGIDQANCSRGGNISSNEFAQEAIICGAPAA